jgi:DNA transformation protein
MPDRLYDDPEELARWTRAAHQAAIRAAARREKPKRASDRKAKPSLGGKKRGVKSK